MVSTKQNLTAEVKSLAVLLSIMGILLFDDDDDDDGGGGGDVIVMFQQLSPLSSQMHADDDTMSDEDSDTGSRQFFVSSAAANTPLVGQLVASAARRKGKLAVGGGLETAAVGSDNGTCSCNAVMDFTALESPSKVSIAACCH